MQYYKDSEDFVLNRRNVNTVHASVFAGEAWSEDIASLRGAPRNKQLDKQFPFLKLAVDPSLLLEFTSLGDKLMALDKLPEAAQFCVEVPRKETNKPGKIKMRFAPATPDFERDASPALKRLVSEINDLCALHLVIYSAVDERVPVKISEQCAKCIFQHTRFWVEPHSARTGAGVRAPVRASVVMDNFTFVYTAPDESRP